MKVQVVFIDRNIHRAWHSKDGVRYSYEKTFDHVELKYQNLFGFDDTGPILIASYAEGKDPNASEDGWVTYPHQTTHPMFSDVVFEVTP